MSYDQKCYDLAASFLSDCDHQVAEATVDALAQLIQQTIEDFIEFDVAMKESRRAAL